MYLHIIKNPPKMFMSQNWVDVFVYDVVAAILNDLHILKKFKVSCLAPITFGISTSMLTRNIEKILFM